MVLKVLVSVSLSLSLDMLVYDHVSTHEDFTPVVCHVCNTVVKPQDVLTHYGKCVSATTRAADTRRFHCNDADS